MAESEEFCHLSPHTIFLYRAITKKIRKDDLTLLQSQISGIHISIGSGGFSSADWSLRMNGTQCNIFKISAMSGGLTSSAGGDAGRAILLLC